MLRALRTVTAYTAYALITCAQPLHCSVRQPDQVRAPFQSSLKTSTSACTSCFLSSFTSILFQGPFALEMVCVSMLILLETISRPVRSLTSGAKHTANALKVSVGKNAHSTLLL